MRTEKFTKETSGDDINYAFSFNDLMEKLIEDKIKEWVGEFTTPNWAGERQLDQICATNYNKDTPIVDDESAIVKKHKEWLRQSLSLVYSEGLKRAVEVIPSEHLIEELTRRGYSKIEVIEESHE